MRLRGLPVQAKLLQQPLYPFRASLPKRLVAHEPCWRFVLPRSDLFRHALQPLLRRFPGSRYVGKIMTTFGDTASVLALYFVGVDSDRNSNLHAPRARCLTCTDPAFSTVRSVHTAQLQLFPLISRSLQSMFPPSAIDLAPGS